MLNYLYLNVFNYNFDYNTKETVRCFYVFVL